MALGALLGRRLAAAVAVDGSRTRIWSTGPWRRTLPPKSRTRQFSLPGYRRKPRPHLLIEQPWRQRRPQQGNAVDVRGVEASGQDVDVDQVFQGFALKKSAWTRRRETGPAFRRVRRPASRRRQTRIRPDCSCSTCLDVPGVLDAGGEDQHGVPIPGVFDDFAAGRLDQFVLVHHLLDLVGDELAGADVQTARCRPFHARPW